MNVFAVMDVAGFVAFATGTAIAYKNYRETRDISDTWRTMTAALAVGSVWTFFKALEWMGVMPVLTDALEDALFFVLAAAMILYGFQAHRGVVKPVT